MSLSLSLSPGWAVGADEVSLGSDKARTALMQSVTSGVNVLQAMLNTTTGSWEPSADFFHPH